MTPKVSIQCDECGSPIVEESSTMKGLCSECAHILYGYPPCVHVFDDDGACNLCGWNQSRSTYIAKVLKERANTPKEAHWPGRESILRAGKLAALLHEDWMQDWPIEVATGERLTEFIDLFAAHRDDWELTLLFLDLVLESARGRADLATFAPRLLHVIVSTVAATCAPALISRLQYWACLDSSLEEAFEVSPIAREALVRLGIPGAPS